MSGFGASIGAMSNAATGKETGGKSAFGGAGAALGPKGMIAEAGMTALSGIFQARAAERARKQQLQLMRDQGQLSVEQQKGQLQQNLIQGLAANLSNAMMSRANARAV